MVTIPGLPAAITGTPADLLALSQSDGNTYQVAPGALVVPAGTGTMTLEQMASGVKASAGSAPASGASITVPNAVQRYYVRGTSTLASLTIVLPAAPINNQNIEIIFQCGVTSLTLSPAAGFTINQPVSGQSVPAGTRITTDLDGTVWC